MNKPHLPFQAAFPFAKQVVHVLRQSQGEALTSQDTSPNLVASTGGSCPILWLATGVPATSPPFESESSVIYAKPFLMDVFLMIRSPIACTLGNGHVVTDVPLLRKAEDKKVVITEDDGMCCDCFRPVLFRLILAPCLG